MCLFTVGTYLRRFVPSSISLVTTKVLSACIDSAPPPHSPTPCTAVYRSAHIPVNQPRRKCHEVYVRLRYTLFGSEALLWKRKNRKSKPVAEYPTVCGMDLGPWSVAYTASIAFRHLPQSRKDVVNQRSEFESVVEDMLLTRE